MRKTHLFLDGFWLKVLAYLFMTLDHIGVFMMASWNGSIISETAYNVGYAFRFAGRLSFPLIVFLLIEGLRHTHNRKKYLLRIVGYTAILMAIEAILIYAIPSVGGSITENPFLDLSCILATLFFLSYLEKPGKQKLFALLSLIPIAYVFISSGTELYESLNAYTVLWFPRWVRAGYGLFGLTMGLLFYYSYKLTDFASSKMAELQGVNLEVYSQTPEYRRNANVGIILALVITMLVFWGLSFIAMDSLGNRPYDIYWMSGETYGLLACVIIYFYNGKRGHDSKTWRWISYLYFPVHLAIIFAIFYLNFGI